MLTPEQREEFNKIFTELAKSLDISKEQHDAAVASYEHVGEWLARPESPLAPYKPEILPQGSFLYGAITKPIHEDDELDIDLVCRLEAKKAEWTQFNLKKIVGDRLSAHATYKRLLDEEGRRCWTLKYADSAKFHLDILPSIMSSNFKVLIEKSMSNRRQEITNVEDLAIRITDKESFNYRDATNPDEWLKSNPFGYAMWFERQASLEFQKAFTLLEAVQPVPLYRSEKEPLVRMVQILKRHRDIMFNGDCDKPISIIITTLAGMAYQKETSIIQGLLNIIDRMPEMIQERYDPVLRKFIKWIPNPVNAMENFADKWPDNPQKEENFNKWIKQIKLDVQKATGERGSYRIQEALGNSFGQREVTKAFSNLGDNARLLTESGNHRMAAVTGILGSQGTKIPQHNFHGKEN